MKKTLLLTLSLLTLSLTGCNNSLSKDSIIPVEGTKNETLKELARQTVLGFYSLSNVNANVLAKRNLTEDEILDVKETLNEIEVLLNEDNKLLVTEKDSDREDYLNSLSLSFTMLDKQSTFTLYYNDIEVKEEKEDDDELETETSFKGIAIYDNIEYNFTYSSEKEEEGNEFEEESVFKLFLNSNSFIKIKQGYEEEFNENEIYYSYELVQDKRKVEEFKFKEETENGKHHIKLEKDNKTYIVKYETKNNEEVLRVALKVNKEETAVGYFKRVVTTDDSNLININYEYLNL